MKKFRMMNGALGIAGIALLLVGGTVASADPQTAAPQAGDTRASDIPAAEVKTSGESLEDLVMQIRHAYQNRQFDEAIVLTDAALRISPDNSMIHRFRTGIHIQTGDMEGAREDLTHVMRLEGADVLLLNERGMINFRLGNFRESVVDFDNVLKLDAERARNAWMRGITLYYAEEYEAGRRQFEFVQRHHSVDIENALWKFLCTTRYHGLGVARATLITNNEDSRVPMEQIHAFYKGRISESELLAALDSLEGTTEQIRQAKFRGHFYLGLFFDANGKRDKAFDYLRQAVTGDFSNDEYLAAVAQVHLKHR